MNKELLLGKIATVAGTTATVRLNDDVARRGISPTSADKVITDCAKVGAMLKIDVDGVILFASIDRVFPTGEAIEAEVSFIGEGSVSEAGILTEFRRGVARYPFPGDPVYGTSHDDWTHIFRADDGTSTISLGRRPPDQGHPRRALYRCAARQALRAARLDRHRQVDQRGALILHRICEAAPKGHIVMIDPHGEYAAAFRTTGVIFDVEQSRRCPTG